MNVASITLLIFALMIAMFVVTGAAIGMNVLLWRRDKWKVAHWLEGQGCRVEKIEWALHPTRRPWLWLMRYSSFDVHFVDGMCARHRAVVAVPTWGAPQFLENVID